MGLHIICGMLMNRIKREAYEVGEADYLSSNEFVLF